MKTLPKIAAIGFALLAGSAFALPPDTEFQQRQRDHMARIQHGVASGRITQYEARQLYAEQRAIRAEYRTFLADGVLTRAERAEVSRDQERASRNIRRQSHDRDYGGYGWRGSYDSNDHAWNDRDRNGRDDRFDYGGR